jgi:type II secretory pathway component PulJ
MSVGDAHDACRGASLVELLVGMLLLALFALAVHQFCSSMRRGVAVLEAASEAQATARLGVQLIVADVREVGFSPAGPLGDGLRQAGPTALAIARDLNRDGDVDDANERVTYQYIRSRHVLSRALGDAAAQPLLDDLDDDGLLFTYLAADGSVLSSDAGQLDAAARTRVRRVAIRLAVAVPNPDPAIRQPLRAVETATATLRNVP